MSFKVVDNSVDVVQAFHALQAVRNDPNALAREVAKWAPDIVYKALKMDTGRTLPIAGYFVGSAIDVLDPQVWQGAALFKLHIEIRSLFESGAIDELEMARIRALVSQKPAEASKEIIIHKIRLKGGSS